MSPTLRMRRRRSLVRRGFTLIEIITSLVILGIVGVGFVKLILSQSRFTEGQMAKRNARTVSRNAMNILLTDLRMVEDNGGLQFASRDSVTVRVPVAFGLLCANTAGVATMQILPVDSSMTAMGQYAGWAYRDSTDGLFKYGKAADLESIVRTAPILEVAWRLVDAVRLRNGALQDDVTVYVVERVDGPVPVDYLNVRR